MLAKTLIESSGGRLHDAAQLAAVAQGHGPRLVDVVNEHIDLLTAVGPDTRSHYRQQLAAHITPLIGGLPVTGVTYRHVAGWVQAMTAKGLAPKTIANVHGLLSAAMSTAIRLGYRPDNPCAGVELPRSVATHDSMCVLTPVEFALLLRCIPEFYRPLVITLVSTGLRWGEVTALTPGDVDLDGSPPTIRVTKAWKRDAARHWYVGPPKTARARRTVSIPDELVTMLEPLVHDRDPGALLFPNTHGNQLTSPRFWTSTWTPALDAAARPREVDGDTNVAGARLTKRPRVHDLRHTHASWMISEGADLFVLQRRLGHESITTTTDTYSHLLPTQQTAAVQAASRTVRAFTKA